MAKRKLDYPFDLIDDEKMNKRLKSNWDRQIKTMDSDGEDVDDIPHNKPSGFISSKRDDSMHTSMMTFTQMLEAMDDVTDSLKAHNEGDMMEDECCSDDDESLLNDKSLIDELNRIYTPTLISMKLSNDVSDKANNAINESKLLTEKSIIALDKPTRMAHLIHACAHLLAAKKNSPSWKLLSKALKMEKEATASIQKEEYDSAKILAQKYLVYVKTANGSAVARDAANELLPETQH